MAYPVSGILNMKYENFNLQLFQNTARCLFNSPSRRIKKKQMKLGASLISLDKPDKRQFPFNVNSRVKCYPLKFIWIASQKTKMLFNYAQDITGTTKDE